MPVVLALYSYMVTARQMDPAVLMAHDSPNQLPAQVTQSNLPCSHAVFDVAVYEG